jgi:hypothetical protein
MKYLHPLFPRSIVQRHVVEAQSINDLRITPSRANLKSENFGVSSTPWYLKMCSKLRGCKDFFVFAIFEGLNEVVEGKNMREKCSEFDSTPSCTPLPKAKLYGQKLQFLEGFLRVVYGRNAQMVPWMASWGTGFHVLN